MKIVIFTGNSIRHKYVANSLAEESDDALVVSECTTFDSIKSNVETSLAKHFNLRNETEKAFFPHNDFFYSKTLPLLYKEVNLSYTYNVIKDFNPDMMFVFGSYLIKEPLLSLTPNKFVNLHLGLSPYYRGTGTNFWPFVNNELEYVGSTLLHLDSGIDTGNIIGHVRPKFDLNDNVHTIGCKVIKESVKHMKKIMNMVKGNKTLPKVKQWKIDNTKYYKNKDFNEKILSQYYKNLENGIVKKFVSNDKKELNLISLD